MEDRNRNLTEREKEKLREYGNTGAENRFNETAPKNDDPNRRGTEDHRADLNGNKGHIKTEHTRPIADESALPGAEEKRDVGNAAAGAGLGGNKGSGTNNKKDFS